jgi:hypothetical protein
MEEQRLRAPVIRARLVLEAISALVGGSDWPEVQVRVQLRPSGDGPWNLCFTGSDYPATVFDVERGEIQIALMNPSPILGMAIRGAGPFPHPVPVRGITVLPQFDQLGFAVRDGIGISSLRQIGERRYPLKVSLRGPRQTSVPIVADLVLQTMGFSLADIESWGGTVRFDQGNPYLPNRLGAMLRGEIDAVFDEALELWADDALAGGVRYLSLEEDTLRQVEALGLRRVAITRAEYPGLGADVMTVDFSGWAVYTHADVPDRVVTAFCAGLEERKDRIPWWNGVGPLPLDRMCRDTREGPLPVPLHPAAERFWHECGYLGG